jgi:hypothetical protein
MFKCRCKLLLKVLLVLIGLVVVFLLIERFRGQIALASYHRELAQGEKLSPQDFTANVSDADNGAPTVVAAIERLKPRMVLPASYPLRMRLVPSGRALVGFQDNFWAETGPHYHGGEWVRETVTNHWDQLALDLKANEATLSEIQAALEKPVLNNRLDFSEGISMKFLHLPAGRALTRWLGSGCQLALREGRNSDALHFLHSEIRLPRLFAEDRIIGSELVRIAIGTIAMSDTWEALQAGGWMEEDLAALQKAWERQEFATAMAHSLEGEKIFCAVVAEQMRASNEDASRMIFRNQPGGLRRNLGESAVKQIYSWVWRFAWSHQAQLREQKDLHWLNQLMRTGTNDKCYSNIKAPLVQLVEDIGEKRFYDVLRYPGLDSVYASQAIIKAMRAETDRSLTLCAIGLKRYSLRHGELPATIEQLVPEFLATLPIDYMDGKPVKYRLNPDGSFTLYSVGEDGKDGGGDLTPPAGSRSKDMWGRRDCVWPAPALPEEIEAYRKEPAKQ